MAPNPQLPSPAPASKSARRETPSCFAGLASPRLSPYVQPLISLRPSPGPRSPTPSRTPVAYLVSSCLSIRRADSFYYGSRRLSARSKIVGAEVTRLTCLPEKRAFPGTLEPRYLGSYNPNRMSKHALTAKNG